MIECTGHASPFRKSALSFSSPFFFPGFRGEATNSKSRQALVRRPIKTYSTRNAVTPTPAAAPSSRPSARPSAFFLCRFLPQISEAYPEVPWVFVFRDPVEVMVSNLKSFASAPCVRIPRQEKARLAAKLAGPKGSPRGPKGRKGGGGGGGQTLDALRQQRKKGALGPGGGRGGRRLSATGGGGGNDRAEGEEGNGGGWMADTMAQGGAVYPLPDAESGVVALWEEEEEEEEEGEEDGGGDCDPFASVSWNSYTSGGLDSLGAPLPVSAFPSHSLGLDSEVSAQQDQRILLPSKRSPQQLTMNMTMECADWLKVRQKGT